MLDKTPPSDPRRGKIEFANTLRGLAALSVLVHHYCYIFWAAPEAVGALIGAPALPVSSNVLTRSMIAILPPSFFGSFGVALFFLISGFVIPFAFLDRSRVEFAVGRVFRLWPTYAVGLTMTALTIWACSTWYGTALPYSISTYGLQLLFVRDFAWIPSVDGIVWTLEIEVKFYIVAMLLAGALRRGRVVPILMTAAGITAFSLVVSHLPGWLHDGSQIFRVFYSLHLNGQMICYMLIGTIFNMLYRGLISLNAFLSTVALLFGSLAVQWPLGNLAGAFGPGITSYGIAIAFFAAAYFGQRIFINTPLWIRWFADVSYPLYVVHGAAGYVIMRVSIDAGFPAAAAIAVALAYALITSWLLHFLVEVPSHTAGKHIAHRMVVHMMRLRGVARREVSP